MMTWFDMRPSCRPHVAVCFLSFPQAGMGMCKENEIPVLVCDNLLSHLDFAADKFIFIKQQIRLIF